MTRARGSVRATRDRMQGAVEAAKLFGVRALTSVATVWHASGEKPTTALWGVNIYSGAGGLLWAAGLAKKLLGRGESSTSDLLMAAGEGPMLMRLGWKALNFRMRGFDAAKKATRTAAMLTRLGADGPADDDSQQLNPAEAVAQRLGADELAAEVVLEGSGGDFGEAERIAQLAAAINS